MKIGNLYNLDSFQGFQDSIKTSGFTDSFAGSVLARNLTAVDPKIFEKKFPELAFVNSGVQADNTGGYTKRIQSLRIQALGSFRTAGDASDNKGKISLAGEDSFIKVIEREAESKWTDSEIKEAELQGINLPQRYVQYHNSIYLREVGDIGLTGGDIGNEGLLNYSGFFASGAGGAIGTLTPIQMYDAIATLIIDQRNAVNNTPEYSANRVIMPVAVMNKLSVTILNTAAGSSTVMRALQDNFPDVQFTASFRAGDVGGASATVAFSTSDEAMKMRIPLALTIGEVVKLGSFNFHVDSKYRIAGLDVLENTAGRILTGL
jgi:hypothetical protein